MRARHELEPSTRALLQNRWMQNEERQASIFCAKMCRELRLCKFEFASNSLLILTCHENVRLSKSSSVPPHMTLHFLFCDTRQRCDLKSRARLHVVSSDAAWQLLVNSSRQRERRMTSRHLAVVQYQSHVYSTNHPEHSTAKKRREAPGCDSCSCPQK